MLAAATVALVWVAAEVAVEPASRSPGAASLVIALMLGGLQLTRRRYPVGVLLGSTAILATYHLLGFAPVGMTWPLLLPLATVAAAGRLTVAVSAMIAITTSTVCWRIVAEHDPVVGVILGEAQGMLASGLAIATGEAIWQRRRWAREVRRRIARVQQDERRESRRQLAEQRLAVAADLHDVAGHSLVVIGLKLHLANETIETDPTKAHGAIQDALRAHDDALRETTASVKVLRGDSPVELTAAGEGRFPDLDGLRRMAELSGIALGATIDVQSIPNPPIGPAIERILHEAMTNTLRHAGAQRVTLEMHERDGGIHLCFQDDGPARDMPSRPGFGIAGMIERATAAGGWLTAAPIDGTGFVVEAWFPLETGR